MKWMVFTLGIAATCLVALNAAAGTMSPAGSAAYIISPANGEVVQSPVTVKFGLQGMGVAPAGVDKAKTGHHHLLIDVSELPPFDKPLPADARHKHFGGGQTETTIELSPGARGENHGGGCVRPDAWAGALSSRAGWRRIPARGARAR
jgi:hypothetical protein